MSYVNIQTAQNVTIQYEIAGITDRIGAYIIDMLILLAYYTVILIVFNGLDLGFDLAVIISFTIPIFIYDLLIEYISNGQSVGKKIMNIKVVMLNGSQPSIAAYLLRWLLRFIDCAPSSGGVAVATIAINGKGQRLGDIAAGTCVVKLRKQIKPEIWMQQEIHGDYTPTYPQAIRLSDNDVAIIRETLQTAVRQHNATLLDTLATKVCSIIEIEKPVNSVEFLKTLLNDYTALTRNTSH